MPATIDSTKSVNFFFRPVGYRNQNGKKPTVEEIETWVQTENPKYIKRQPYLSLFGVIATAVGLVAEVFGFKKESNLTKWLGGVLTLLGISATGIGIMWTKFTDELRGSVRAQSTDDIGDAKKKLDKEKVLSDLIELSKVEQSNKNQKRREFLDKYSGCTVELEAFLNEVECGKVQSEKISIDVTRESTQLIISLIHKGYIQGNLPLIEKTLSGRRNAASLLLKADSYYDKKLVETFIAQIKDPIEDLDIKSIGFRVLKNQISLNPELEKEVIELCLSILSGDQESIKLKKEATSCIGDLASDQAVTTLLALRKKYDKEKNLIKALEEAIQKIIQRSSDGINIVRERMRSLEVEIDDLNIGESGSTVGEFNYFDLALITKDIPTKEVRKLIRTAQRPISQEILIKLFSDYGKQQ
ncbi:MAG: hypothetical protein HYR97_03220 [Candidatus Melainabacteria bacterium]|nr:hypothetical protein [Candidatus Melainabacteria bacterium]